MGGGAKSKLFLKVKKNELFCWHFMKKSENKKAHFLGFGDKGWEGWRQLCNCLQETKYELLFFCKHSLVSKNAGFFSCAEKKKKQPFEIYSVSAFQTFPGEKI